MGCVLRGMHSQIVMAVTQPELHHDDPLEMEFLEIFRKLQHCVPMNVDHFDVKTDCLVAM